MSDRRPSYSPPLAPAQIEMLRAVGRELKAHAGDVLFRAGDRTYPFIAILDGEVAIVDGDGDELMRHGPAGFLGELNLLTGQTVFVTAVATKPLRYLAIDREQLRRLLFADGPLSEALLGALSQRRELLQELEGVGVEILGPHSSDETMRILRFARSNLVPHTWIDAPAPEGRAPVVRLPSGAELSQPSTSKLSRALGFGRELAQREEVDLAIIGAGPAGLGAAVYGASEGLDTLVIESTALGGQAGTSRRIENYLGFPGGITGSELTSRAALQARKFAARTATPYRAVALEPADDRHVIHLEEGQEVEARAVIVATGAQYRRLPIDGLSEFEGSSVFYAAGPPEGKRCVAARVAVVGGGNSAGQAAIWLSREGAVVTLLHRRADLRETMSDYLIHDLARAGVAVRGEAEVVDVHGRDGRLESVTLSNGERHRFSFLFLFLGAAPHTDWLDGVVRRDADGFILTGPSAEREDLLETSVPGVLAAGDVRSGSAKRCATAVGEGAMAVQFVHKRLAWRASPAADPPATGNRPRASALL